MKRHLTLLLGVAVGTLVVPNVRAQGQSKDQSNVEARERDALAACDSGQVQKGIDLLARLWADTLEPTYVYDQGRCYQKASMPKEALARFQEFVRVAKDSKDEPVAQAEQFIKELQADTTEREHDQAAKVLPTAAEIRSPPRAPNPEAPHVDLLATGSTPSSAETRAIYQRSWFWIAAGVVAAGSVAAVLLLARGGSSPVCPECAFPTTRVPTQ
jgi:hypothetical protein